MIQFLLCGFHNQVILFLNSSSTQSWSVYNAIMKLPIAVSKVHFHLPLTSCSTVISATAIPATTISTTIISNTSLKMIHHIVIGVSSYHTVFHVVRFQCQKVAVELVTPSVQQLVTLKVIYVH
ncbi:hypothetical protein T4C_13729 [Trichinella pseudospiralis]|uniref:Uncharacterized protein n=1 Tax=Trichinella pseudospiralis TaxID=6337 RepID=A0A0V1JTH6_TRIPS|nr:hypothetical protein T4C_13729 [Trichinella pseudospiralis]